MSYDSGDIILTVLLTVLYMTMGKGAMTALYHRKNYFEGAFALVMLLWPISLVYYSFRSGEDL